MRAHQDRRPLWFLIFLSGAAGLVYQVVWQKYLGILLGAQARATAVVLAIFLGGISVGYATFGRWSLHTRRNLLAAYAVVEGGLALWALLFPTFFHLAFRVAGAMYANWGVDNLVVDILLSALLVGPPTILMGGTLPLLTQGLSEDLSESSRTHAAIYGYNTLGACVGALLAGYVLVPTSSLPAAGYLAGLFNAIVGVTVYGLYVYRRREHHKPVEVEILKESFLDTLKRAWPLYAVGLLSGWYVITLETVLVRLMGLSTGASEYNFTLILSIFVFSLGFGSLLVRGIGKYTESRLFWNQVTIAATLLLLYLTGDSWPYWVHRVRVIFRDQVENFYLYHTLLGLFFLALLAIPIGFCGLTMPLCFHLGKDRKETLGHRVGQLYAVNTIGCVLGALLGGYIALEYINLDQLFKVCVAAALVSALCAGVAYVRRTQAGVSDTLAGGIIFGMVFVGLIAAPSFDKEAFLQPFRQQNVITDITYEGKRTFVEYLGAASSYVFYKDGPNTSVGVGKSTTESGEERARTLFVNGKSDGNTRGDARTMAMTGHIPGMLAPSISRTCVIGFGTGVTAGSLARYQETETVDVVEIAGTVIDAAPLFDSYNGGVSQHPKIRFHQMDAFRFLAGARKGFDVVVSEPSNPWVAGVENLYTAEFYQTVKRHLNPDGVFVQWVQTYSFDDELVKLVLRTITSEFPTVSVFQMLDHDLALVAWPREMTRQDLAAAEKRWRDNPGVRAHLQTIGISRLEGLLAYELISPELTKVLAGPGPLHHLEHPRLSHPATKAFFSGSTAKVHALRRTMKEFYPAVAKSLLSTYLEGEAPSADLTKNLRLTFCEAPVHRANTLCEEALVMQKWDNPKIEFEEAYAQPLNESAFRDIASLRLSPKRKFTRNDLLIVQHNFDFYKMFYSPVARIPIEPIVEKLDNCLQNVDETEGLFGDCLLQKAAVLEVALPRDPDFIRTVQRFMDWYRSLPQDHADHRRFRRGADVLERLLVGAKST